MVTLTATHVRRLTWRVTECCTTVTCSRVYTDSNTCEKVNLTCNQMLHYSYLQSCLHWQQHMWWLPWRVTKCCTTVTCSRVYTASNTCEKVNLTCNQMLHYSYLQSCLHWQQHMWWLPWRVTKCCTTVTCSRVYTDSNTCEKVTLTCNQMLHYSYLQSGLHWQQHLWEGYLDV